MSAPPGSTQSRIDTLELPAAMRSTLAEWVERLLAAAGPNLRSIQIYGSAARGDFVLERSDLNVLVALDPLDLDVLDRVAPVLEGGRRDLDLSPLVLSPRDVHSSADIFPIKFLDMQRHSVCIWGQNLLEDLRIDRSHLRLRCEQEIKNLLFRLRRFYLESAGRREFLAATLARAASTLLGDLRSLLLIRRGEAPVDASRIASEAAEELSLAAESIADLLRLRSGAADLSLPQLRSHYAEMLQLVSRAADLVDRQREDPSA